MRKNSIKNTRINAEVRRELSQIISSEIKDPRVDPWTTVTEVEVAPDLKTCKVYVSVLGGEESAAETVAGLKSAQAFIRRELAHSLNLRNTPELFFYADRSIAHGVEMVHRIEEVTKDLPADEPVEEEDVLTDALPEFDDEDEEEQP